MSNKYSHLSKNLTVHHGVINVGILRNKGQILLIDFGDGSVRTTLNELGTDITDVESVVFTHHHRDQVSGIVRLAKAGVKIGVPTEESEWFESIETFWNNPETRWHLYSFHPHNLMLAESISVNCTYQEGDVIEWGKARISVLDTPGHTNGAVSYVVEVDGSKFVFCGDTIYDKGKIWELYSLQKGNNTITDYHGFLGSREQLKESLLKLRTVNPTALIPSHGNIMYEPADAIDVLLDRLDKCYDKYVAISALRYYFPDMFAEFEGREGHMPIRSGKTVPDFLRHFGTTWLILSENREAFVMDCGNPNVIKNIQELQNRGEISRITGLWVTHYHDDHVDAIPQFVDKFGCSVYADLDVAKVLENPRGFRIPCISPVKVKVDNHTKDGESWKWNEFEMTAYHFPGQTYYHGGLFVKGQGIRIFFAGDSFTMAGIDDYCSGNRNWLGKNTGFDRCLKIIQELKPTHIFNCHVDKAFDFTDKEIQFMRANLSQREELYRELFPWDSPNYGMDEHWVRCYPYEQDAIVGETVVLNVKITNHSTSEILAVCRPIFPESWNMKVKAKSANIPAKSDGQIRFSFKVPESAFPNRTVIPVDLTYNGRKLGQFREAILVVRNHS